MGIRNFRDRATAKLAGGLESKKSRGLLPRELHRAVLKKLQILRAAKQLDDPRNFPGLKLEKLKGSRKSEYSIRINDQFRICFRWDSGFAYDVGIEDYH